MAAVLILINVPAFRSDAASSGFFTPEFASKTDFYSEIQEPFPLSYPEYNLTFSKPDNYYGDPEMLRNITAYSDRFGSWGWNIEDYDIYFMTGYGYTENLSDSRRGNVNFQLYTYYYFVKKGDYFGYCKNVNNSYTFRGNTSLVLYFVTNEILYLDHSYSNDKIWDSYYSDDRTNFKSGYTYFGREHTGLVRTNAPEVLPEQLESYCEGSEYNELNRVSNNDRKVGCDSFGWDSFDLVQMGESNFLCRYFYDSSYLEDNRTYLVSINIETVLKYIRGDNKQVKSKTIESFESFDLSDFPVHYFFDFKIPVSPEIKGFDRFCDAFNSYLGNDNDIANGEDFSLHTYITVFFHRSGGEKIVVPNVLGDTSLTISTQTSADVRCFDVDHFSGVITDKTSSLYVSTYEDVDSDGNVNGKNVSDVVLNDELGSNTVLYYSVNDYNQTSVNSGKYDYSVNYKGNTWDSSSNVNNSSNGNQSTVTNNRTNTTTNSIDGNTVSTGSGGSGGSGDGNDININYEPSIDIDDDGNLTTKDGKGFWKGFKSLFGLMGEKGLLKFLTAALPFVPDAFWSALVACLGMICVALGIKILK